MQWRGLYQACTRHYPAAKADQGTCQERRKATKEEPVQKLCNSFPIRHQNRHNKHSKPNFTGTYQHKKTKKHPNSTCRYKYVPLHVQNIPNPTISWLLKNLWLRSGASIDEAASASQAGRPLETPRTKLCYWLLEDMCISVEGRWVGGM